jgi:hypothetical protein
MAVCAPPSFIDEVAGHIQVLGLPGDPVEFNERHFDDRMAGWYVFLVFTGPEYLAYQIGIFNGHIQQGMFSSSLLMSHCGFV